MGTHPYQLVEYTPAELEAFLRYAQAKRDKLDELA
jgi:hypothetical protein